MEQLVNFASQGFHVNSPSVIEALCTLELKTPPIEYWYKRLKYCAESGYCSTCPQVVEALAALGMVKPPEAYWFTFLEYCGSVGYI